MAGEEYLPPVVIEVSGQDRDFLTTIEEDKSVLADFAKQVTETQISADDAPLAQKIAQAQLALSSFAREVSTAKVDADVTPFWTAIAALHAELSRDPAELDVTVGGLGRAMADIALLRGALASVKTETALSAALPAAGAGGGALAGILGALGGAGGVGGIGRALWPKGGTFGFAPFGSVAGMAGFGFEHVLTTGLGLAGSATGAALGGGVLAGSALATTAVGMGTDLAGIGQAAGDIKMVSGDMTALNAAIGVYGKGSVQAAQAQAQLNYDLTQFNPVARQAVTQAAVMAQGFRTQFDAVTGQAEKTGAQIISQFIGVAQKFLPTIGKFASENMAIIQRSLQPLAAWIQGPGLAIFTKLEEVFQAKLPTAIHAFTQGLELIARTIGFVAPQTGKLLTHIDNLLTRLNGPGWGKWQSDISKVINLFHVWDAFIVILVKDIAKIFGASKGLGTGIIQDLTDHLNKLYATLNKKGGTDSLANLFAAHKAEILAFIDALIQAGASFTKFYLLAAPALTGVVTLLLKGASAMMTFVSHIPGGGTVMSFALGLALMGSKLGILTHLFTGNIKEGTLLQRTFGLIGKGIITLLARLGALVTLLPRTFGLIGSGITSLLARLGALVAGMIGVEIESEGLNAVLGASVIGGIILLGVVIFELVKHWNTVWSDIKAIFDDAVRFLRSGFGTLILLIMGPIGYMLLLALHWQAVWDTMKSVGLDAWHFIDNNIIHPLVSFFTSTWKTITGAAKLAWSALWGGMKEEVQLAWDGIKAIINTIIDGINVLVHGFDDVTGFLHLGPHVSPIPKLALGGYLAAGQPAIVGDAMGAGELFVPSSPGRVYAAGTYSQGSSSETVYAPSYSPTYHIIVQGGLGTPTEISRQFQKVLDAHDTELLRRMSAQNRTF